jgi:GNAT superfamily N-acetyltransferase
MNTAIVVAGPAHLSGLVDSAHELFAEDGGRYDARTDLGWPRRDGRQYYSALLVDDNALCLVARRSGVGSALVARFDSWARKRGARHFSVTAYSGNAAAVAFYRRHGFREMSVTLARS